MRIERRCERSPRTLKILSDMVIGRHDQQRSWKSSCDERKRDGACGWESFVEIGTGGTLELGELELSSLSFRNAAWQKRLSRVWHNAFARIAGNFPQAPQRSYAWLHSRRSFAHAVSKIGTARDGQKRAVTSTRKVGQLNCAPVYIGSNGGAQLLK